MLRRDRGCKGPEQRHDREMAGEGDLLVCLNSCKELPEVSPIEVLIMT